MTAVFVRVLVHRRAAVTFPSNAHMPIEASCKLEVPAAYCAKTMHVDVTVLFDFENHTRAGLSFGLSATTRRICTLLRWQACMIVF